MLIKVQFLINNVCIDRIIIHEFWSETFNPRKLMPTYIDKRTVKKTLVSLCYLGNTIFLNNILVCLGFINVSSGLIAKI